MKVCIITTHTCCRNEFNPSKHESQYYNLDVRGWKLIQFLIFKPIEAVLDGGTTVAKKDQKCFPWMITNIDRNRTRVRSTGFAPADLLPGLFRTKDEVHISGILNYVKLREPWRKWYLEASIQDSYCVLSTGFAQANSLPILFRTKDKVHISEILNFGVWRA